MGAYTCHIGSLLKHSLNKSDPIFFPATEPGQDSEPGLKSEMPCHSTMLLQYQIEYYSALKLHGSNFAEEGVML